MPKKENKKVELFQCTQPCNNCPYRKDAPLAHWAVEEYEKLLETENDIMGVTYGCHKNNGSVCIGWLMKQQERGLPSIKLRMALSKHDVSFEYLEGLTSPSPLYDTVEEMIEANYPGHFKKE